MRTLNDTTPVRSQLIKLESRQLMLTHTVATTIIFCKSRRPAANALCLRLRYYIPLACDIPCRSLASSSPAPSSSSSWCRFVLVWPAAQTKISRRQQGDSTDNPIECTERTCTTYTQTTGYGFDVCERPLSCCRCSLVRVCSVVVHPLLRWHPTRRSDRPPKPLA